MNRYLQAAHDSIARETGSVHPELIAQPLDGRWSIAEILEHLTLAFTKNAEVMRKALASGELRARPPTFTQRLARVLVVDIGYFPRAEAPEATRPSGSIPADRILAATFEALLALDETLTLVSARFGDAVRVATHPYFAGMTVPQWRKFHWRHTIHHMRQVRSCTAEA